MKRLLVLFLLLTSTVFSQSNENYIKTTEFTSTNIATTPVSLILNSPVSNTNYTASQSIVLKPGFHATANVSLKILPNSIPNQESITYYDGLGKPKQQIAIGQSPDGKDIVQHIEYDEFGRVSLQFLPHEYSGGTLGTYRTNAQWTTKQYYKLKYPADFPGPSDGIGIDNTTPYSERTFELSPLNRLEKQSSPGELFKMGSGHELKFEYKANIANEVRKYSVNSDGSLGGGTSYYSAGELNKNIVKDKNWKSSDNKNYTTEDFKDKLGKTILKRFYNNNVPHDIFFVYDNLDNIKYVLPPKSEPQTAKPDANELSELCYQYKYDDWNRLIEKKLPGKQWEYIIYDSSDRPILTQDNTLKASNLWAFNKFDTYGRIIYTGLYSSTKNRASLQVEVDNFINTNNKNNSEDRITTTKTIGQVAVNYENTAFPTTNITEVLAVNYYDDYNFTDADKPSIPTSVLNQPVTNRTNGLHTSSWIKTLGQNTWAKAYTFYDEKGRELRVYAKNYLGGYTMVDSEIDFSGIVTKTVSSHKKTASDALVTITDEFEYDHASRLKKQVQQINSAPKETIASNIYDGTGMLVQKKTGGKTSPLQTIDYKYNVQGSLTSINDVNSSLPTTPDNDLFAFKLNYENPVEGTANVPQLFNGNVTQTTWRNSITNDKQSYTYNYDDLSRISNANYRKGSSLNTDAGKFELSGITYDKAGNINSLQRTGTSGQIDNLTYKYETVGVKTNKLVDVTDSTNNAEGYKDTNASGDNYTYDTNGRLIGDKNKGVTNIQYNYLDLPTVITFSNGNSIQVTYDASGNKLEKLYITAGGNTKTLYVNGFQYQNNQLQFFGHSEGYTYKDGNNYKYAYVHRDHLGNNRLSYSDTNGNGSISNSEISSKTDYYPFGLSHSGEYIAGIGSNYNYKYQGKELQAENGLQQYDFGSRIYDGATGRWFVVDPQAEQFYGLSPYLAMGNSPIMVIDPDGEWIHILVGAVIGGVVNVVSNWDNIDSFGDGLKYFGVGAASGAVTAATGNLAAGGAIMGLGNGLVQGQRGYDLLQSTAMGAITSAVGGSLGKAISPLVGKLGVDKLTQNITSPYIKNAINYGVNNAITGGLVGGTLSELTGGDFSDGFKSGAAFGGATGAAGGLFQAHLQVKANNKELALQKELKEPTKKEVLRGSRNPKVKAAAARGREIHKQYNSDLHDGVTKIKEYRLPSGKRIDFLDIENGKIYELKPNNLRAIKLGFKQLNTYLNELKSIPQFKNIDWKIILETYD